MKCNQNCKIMKTILNNIETEKKVTSFRLSKVLLDKLKIAAKQDNRSLNNFVECVLISAVTDEVLLSGMSDEEVYAWLVKNKPEGKVFVSEKEQAEFEKYLGI